MITVTGTTGHLGRLVVDELLSRGVPAAQIVAAVRDPAKATDLSARGVIVRHFDYDHAETLAAALTGTERLLLVSSNAVGQRIEQHRNIIDAAVAAGVASIAYTSVLHADTSKIGLAAEHLTTEDLLKASGLPFTLLRNSWYIENYTATLAQTIAQQVILGSAGTGQVAAATRADFAAAAATVLTSQDEDGAIYELGGDVPFTMAELADTITRVTGTTVTYQNLTASEHVAALVAGGLPHPVAEFLADADAGIARGDLDTKSGDLRRLIARPTTSLEAAVAAAVTL